MKAGLTPKQGACLSFIRLHIAETGASPSFAEIKVALDLSSKANVHRLVSSLVERGHLLRLAGRARSLWPTDDTFAPGLPALDRPSSEQLRRVIAVATGLLADREGCAHAAEVAQRCATQIGSLPTGGVQ